jgi:ribosomal protein uL24
MVTSQPRKQRKRLYTTPKHLRRKIMCSALAKPLKEQYKKNSFPVVKNDKVKVMSGKYAGKEGKVLKISTKTFRIGVEGIMAQTKKGKEHFVMLPPSKMIITELNLKDKKREAALQRK